MKIFSKLVGKVDIIYRPGKDNLKADSLSQNPAMLGDEVSEHDEVQVAQIRDAEISQLLEVSPFETRLSDFSAMRSREKI